MDTLTDRRIFRQVTLWCQALALAELPLGQCGQYIPRVRFFTEQEHLLHPECICCLTWYHVSFHLRKSDPFYFHYEKSAVCTRQLLWKRHFLFWVRTTLKLPLVAATVSDSDEVCDHVQFGEQDYFFLFSPHPNTSAGCIHAELDKLKCIGDTCFMQLHLKGKKVDIVLWNLAVPNDLCQWKVSTRRGGMFIMRIRREIKHEVKQWDSVLHFICSQ